MSNQCFSEIPIQNIFIIIATKILRAKFSLRPKVSPRAKMSIFAKVTPC